MVEVVTAAGLESAGEEEQWVRRAQAGDTEAFERLVLKHNRFVYNLALRLLGDPAEAEDVAQEACLRAWRGLPTFRQQARFRTWLYRITANLCYNRLPRLRQELQRVSLEAEELGDEAAPESARLALRLAETGPEEALLRGELAQQVQAAVAALPDPDRLLVQLRYQQDLPYEEIAVILQLPLGTVKTHLFRLHQRLRRTLAEACLPAEAI